MRKYRSIQTNGSTPLEPRVAQLEVGLDRLTDDVANLANVVREQGSQMEQDIQKLIVAVTQAGGPRKTDWSTIIAGVMLVLAIGSAAFWPLNQNVQETKSSFNSLYESFQEHARIANHPVGEALIDRLEYQLKECTAERNKDREELTTHFNDEMTEAGKFYDQRFEALIDKMNIYNDRLYNRILELERRNSADDSRNIDELSKWRHKAMGSTDPSSYVPLVPRTDPVVK